MLQRSRMRAPCELTLFDPASTLLIYLQASGSQVTPSSAPRKLDLKTTSFTACTSSETSEAIKTGVSIVSWNSRRQIRERDKARKHGSSYATHQRFSVILSHQPCKVIFSRAIDQTPGGPKQYMDAAEQGDERSAEQARDVDFTVLQRSHRATLTT